MTQMPNHPTQQAPHPGFWRRNLLWIILLAVPLVALAGIVIIGLAHPNASGAEPISYSQFIAAVKDHNVNSVTLENNSVTGTFMSPVASDQTHARVTTFTTIIPGQNTDAITTLLANGVAVNVVNDNSNGVSSLLLQWMPILLLTVPMYLVLVGCLALYLSGRSRPPTQHSPA